MACLSFSNGLSFRWLERDKAQWRDEDIETQTTAPFRPFFSAMQKCLRPLHSACTLALSDRRDSGGWGIDCRCSETGSAFCTRREGEARNELELHHKIRKKRQNCELNWITVSREEASLSLLCRDRCESDIVSGWSLSAFFAAIK